MLPSKLQGGLMSAKRMEPSAGHHQLRRRKAARLEQPVIEPLHSLAHIDLGRPSCGGFEPPRVRNVVALVAPPPMLNAWPESVWIFACANRKASARSSTNRMSRTCSPSP